MSICIYWVLKNYYHYLPINSFRIIIRFISENIELGEMTILARNKILRYIIVNGSDPFLSWRPELYDFQSYTNFYQTRCYSNFVKTKNVSSSSGHPVLMYGI